MLKSKITKELRVFYKDSRKGLAIILSHFLGTLGIFVVVWALQLVLNGAWSWIMFGQHQIGLALADIFLLWISIVLFAVLAWTVSLTASLLFVPYLAWVSYAGALNFAIWRLNG